MRVERMSAFAGKTILVTGAAGGIGQQICRLFAQRGGRIAALDRNAEVNAFVRTLNASGYAAAAVVADIGSLDEVSVAIDDLQKKLGRIDILINNAGFSGAASLETTTTEVWHTDIDVNLNGAFHCTSIVLNDMKSAESGVIVNIGSVNGISALGDPAYSAAKAALISYTKSLAMEYGRFGIRANVICPGTVRTPIWEHRVKKNPEILDQLVKWYPLRRVAEPDDIARVAAFLASDEAAAITGVMLPVDCGLSAGNIMMTRELTLMEF